MGESSFQRVAGGVTAPQGFLAGGAACGIKTAGKDLGILYSEAPCVVAGVFTTNRIQAESLKLTHSRLGGSIRAVVVNSGNANACTGPEGYADAEEMARLAAEYLNLPPEEVLVGSTGLIGARLPMDNIREGVSRIQLSRDGGHQFAHAIMTTDTRPKEAAVSLDVGGALVRIGAAAKGAGMIHPNMATMLCFIATDARVEPGFLQDCLRRGADRSFNAITIDGDTSPKDMALLLAKGAAGNAPLSVRSRDSGRFSAALIEVMTALAKAIAADGEGATKLIEVRVVGAATEADARLVARTVAGSTLVKAAVYGGDPNWGRVVVAAGRSGASIDPERLRLTIGAVELMRDGRPLSVDRERAAAQLQDSEIVIQLDLGLGDGTAVAWGCDLTEEYVSFNARYTT
ncbi:MAG: bifunctional glutamate N-acetyltransferase/amino-acid acetyltransferase ArgJ [Chloroflexi bacterium]|nr:bifunctional glutamate N-acetyltransferase/amino-acid acetyltransferase ArgJ [Chloroflexota bacterium]